MSRLGIGFRIRALGVAGLLPALLAGCSSDRMPMLNPLGYVGETEKELLLITMAIMAAIVIPVILLALFIAWRYRASSEHADYDPEFDESKPITAITIFVPLLTITTLGALTWVYTHRLDPYRPVGEGKPYEIQAVALDYKWLFIYPEAGVATVNELAAPVDRPVTIRLTSDPMMTSLFIPGLTSQIYAMPGMETRSNFKVSSPATFDGANGMFSGPDFSVQRFKTRLMAQDEFASWLNDVANGTGGDGVKVEDRLDTARYQQLAKLSTDNPVTYFRSVDGDLFPWIVRQFVPAYTMNALPDRAEFIKEH